MINDKSTEIDSKWLTVYVDAGFANGIGTYGIWVRIQPGRRTFEGKLPNVINNNEAEMAAAVLGLKHGLAFWREHYKENPAGITIASDSNHTRVRLSAAVIPAYTKSGNRVSIMEQTIHKEFYSLLPKGVFFRFKPVKGHSGKRKVAGWLNDWCDQASRRARNS